MGIESFNSISSLHFFYLTMAVKFDGFSEIPIDNVEINVNTIHFRPIKAKT